MKCIFFLLPVILLFSCEKEHCEDLDNLVNMQGQSLFGVIHPVYGYPYFNPNNADELMFYYQHNEPVLSRKLIKYQLSTGNYEVIFEGLHSAQPKWSKNGWVLLSLWNRLGNDRANIWKIKDTGDSLTQLTTAGTYFFPEWNEAGDKYVYQFSDPGTGIESYYGIATKDGTPIDTLSIYPRGNSSWQHDSLFAYTDTYGLYISDFTQGTIDTLYQVDTPNSISRGGVAWLDDENIVWTHLEGVYRTNVQTKETTRLIESCNSDYYQYPTYAPQTEKIVMQRVERIRTDGDEGIANARLYMMKKDGSDLELLELEIEE